jgi:hypothetical protein
VYNGLGFQELGMSVRRHVFIDDIRDPDWVYGRTDPIDWEVLRTAPEFFAWLKAHGLPQVISFDHDLGGVDEEGNEVDPLTVPTGMDCAHALVEYCLDRSSPLPECRIHSANPVGVANLVGLLEGFCRHQQASGLAGGPVFAVTAHRPTLPRTPR